MIKKYLNVYVSVWKSILKLHSFIYWKIFWLFVIVNFVLFLIINGILDFLETKGHAAKSGLLFLLGLSSVLAAIKSKSNIKKGVNEQNTSHAIQNIDGYVINNMGMYDYLKLLLYSIMIGVINLFSPAFAYKDEEVSLSFFFIISIYSAIVAFLSFIIFPLGTVLLKRRLTNYSMFIYFFFFLFFSIIIQFVFLQADEYK